MRCNNNKIIRIEYAAKSLINVAENHDNEIGDDTTNIMLFAGELLKEAKHFIEDGMYFTTNYNYWLLECFFKRKEKLRNCSINIECKNYEEKRNLLIKYANSN